MGLTQKYKQQQQQVRIQTNESNYIKGMQFVEHPLAEGYSRMLVNFDIDSISGKLTPRKGLKSLGVVHPTENARTRLSHTSGYNTVVESKVCYSSNAADKRQISKSLQSVLYNTDTRSFLIATGAPDITENATFDVIPLSIDSEEEYATPEPFIIAKPEIHGKECIHNNFYKRPVGTFAFGNSYYTFLKHNYYMVKLISDLPNANYPGVNTYEDLKALYPNDTPGGYFRFIDGDSEGVLAYYDAQGVLVRWLKSEQDLLALKSIPDPNSYYVLCYTRLGADIKADSAITLFDKTLKRDELEDDVYYVCVVQPDKLNPTEASSWGYNMLLEDPYNFVCENTATNLVTILGILPYDKFGNIVLTPRKNQEVTLKAFYRAPTAYHSDTENMKYYSTTKKGEVENAEDLDNIALENYGDWWYVTSTKEYYMVIPHFEPGVAEAIKKVLPFGLTKPKASERLNGTSTEGVDKIHLIWQMRQAGASDWQTIHDETVELSAYRQNDVPVPFIVNTTLPAEETMVRLVVTDPIDKAYPDAIDMPAVDNEYILSTVSVGLSLVADELANTLNLTPKNYDLGQATGMCEWEQRLVLWGVPDALNTIFISDVGNPNFFPYPNNVDIFTDPIISVHNYGNELLVLTTSALYRLTWDTEGLGWTHTLVQQNLHVTLEDTYMSCVIKNMFFFKSGEYYYMMVPKATSSNVRGEVAIAPISKPIEGLLDNFHKEMYNLIRVIVDRPDLDDFTNRLVNYFSYIDNTKVVVNYVYSLNTNVTQDSDTEDLLNSKYLYIQLIYDTDARTWSIRAFEAAHMLYASHADAIQQDRFIDVTPALSEEKLVLQYYQFQDYADTSVQCISETNTEIPVERILKNYQYLDTGNREINTELKKRFREFQFKIKNNTATNLGFYTSFLIDGSMRRDLQRYEPRYILDEHGEPTVIIDKVIDPDALIVFDRVLDPNAMIYKTDSVERIIVPARMLQDSGELTPTTLAEKVDADRWILNQSAFPGRTLCKIRMAISGKGLSPRAIMLSTNEQNFEILGHCWVYRTMHSR